MSIEQVFTPKDLELTTPERIRLESWDTLTPEEQEAVIQFYKAAGRTINTETLLIEPSKEEK